MKIKAILLLMAVAVMSSCHSDFEDDGKVKYLRFGYIEGNIGDSYVNLYNTDDDCDRVGWSWREERSSLESANWGVTLQSSSSSVSRIFLRLCSLHRGEYNIKRSFDDVYNDSSEDRYLNSGFELEIINNGDTIIYGPKRENPFLVYVTDVRYDPYGFGYDLSIVEGYMNGVLYNRENPSDSIVFDHVRFGFH